MVRDDSDALEPEAKRRRIRKGTHSCWECKRRKVRCTFTSSTDAICIPCRRRGTKCIGQEVPEELVHPEHNADRMVRFEALLDRLVTTIDRNTKDGTHSVSDDGLKHKLSAALTPASGLGSSPSCFSYDSAPVGLTPVAFISTPGRNSRVAKDTRTNYSRLPALTPDSPPSPATRAAPSGTVKYDKISQALLAALPAQKDVQILLKRCEGNTTFCDMITNMLHSQKSRDKLAIEARLAETPGPRTHPVLLAKYMLMLASLLMNLPSQEHIHSLSEHHRTTMERLADTAISLVTTNEELLGSLESLECILLEGLYHLNYGNIRRAWLAYRRAMVAAQLIGICRPRCPPVKKLEADTTIDPQFVWWNIVYMDRFLSLLLGLPTGHSNLTMESDTALASGTPNDRLERAHALISAKILQRNQLTPSQRYRTMTRDIDSELRKTAESLPADFWRPLEFAGLEKDSVEAFTETMRVRNQVVHYTLLNQLHLPFLLCPNICDNQYSRVSCVYASREILTRFITFRAFDSVSACCRLADFLALVAGMTLMLAHLDSHRHKEDHNFLAHQRLGDRATVEQALGHMELSSKLNEDMLAAKCADLLQYLLRIEADAAKVQGSIMDKAQGPDDGQSKALFITVPYFGTVRIARDGIKFMDTVRSSYQHANEPEADITIGGIGSVRVADHTITNDQRQPSAEIPANLDDSANYPPPPNPCVAQVFPESQLDTADSAQPPSAIMGDGFMMQHDLFPGLTAGINDWVFQGVDTAFFDSLMTQTDFHLGDGDATTEVGRTE